MRAWLDANRDALTLWLEGTERPDALSIPVDRIEIDTQVPELDALRDLTRLAVLEASRRMEAGDPVAAWPYLRGLVRTAAHLSRHAYLVQRQYAAQFLRLAHPRILTWSQDPRLPPDALRQAIADLDEATRLLPPNSESILPELRSQTAPVTIVVPSSPSPSNSQLRDMALRHARPIAPETRKASLWIRPLRAFERSRGWCRRLMILVALLGIPPVGLLVYRHAAVADLPDVGDPFDVRAFLESAGVPDDRNAFLLYRKAVAALAKGGPFSREHGRIAILSNYAAVGPQWHNWLEQNRRALGIWLEGTARPESLQAPIDRLEDDRGYDDIQALHELQALAKLEALRLIEASNMTGAWKYLNALVRCRRHLLQNAALRTAYFATIPLREDLALVGRWMSDTGTTSAELRQALADLTEAEKLDRPSSDSIKVDYVHVKKRLSDADEVKREAFDRLKSREPSPALFLAAGPDVIWFALNEPDRSLRVARLAFANWLSQSDRPSRQRAPSAASSETEPQSPSLFLFDTTGDPSAPEAARVLSPEAIRRWLRSCLAAPHVLDGGSVVVVLEERHQALDGLRFAVATELYTREHGGPPSPMSRLVVEGYLERLPRGYVDADEKPVEP